MKVKHFLTGLLIISALSTFVKEVACAEIDPGHSLVASSRSALTLHDADAQFTLGQKYETGQGVVQDYKEAVRLYTLVAEQGHADGQYNLGLMYEFNRGVDQDYEEALRLYTLAAGQGHSGAQVGLARLEERGVKKGHAFLSPSLSSSMSIRDELQQLDFPESVIDNIWAYLLPISINPLPDKVSTPLSSGVYESDNIELILSTLLSHFINGKFIDPLSGQVN